MARISIAIVCAIALAILCATLNDAAAQPRGRDAAQPRGRDAAQSRSRIPSQPVPLGCYPIKLRGPDAGTIRVDLPGNQRFRGVQLKTIGASVSMQEMRVISPTGQPDELPVDGLNISGRDPTQELFLRNEGHEVRQIEFKFTAIDFNPSRSAICVDGIPSGATPRNWVEIGCHTVDFSRNERDPIRITNPNAMVERLRITVRDNDVQVDNFSVRYRGGRSDDLTSQVNPRLIRADRRTRSVRLAGGAQQIFEVNLRYVPPANPRGTAVACVEGLEIPPTPRPQTPNPDVAGPPPAGWERLGCDVVWSAGGGATVNVSNDRGRYTAIQVQAFLSGLRVSKLDIMSSDGRPIRLQPFRVARDAYVSRYFNEGPTRIGSIAVSSSADSNAGGIICLNGQKMTEGPTDLKPDPTNSPGPSPARGWREIGCQLAQVKPEYDVYAVGRSEGPYSQLMLQARRGSVKLYGIKVVFENNDEETWNAGENREIVIEDGKWSPPLPLAGGNRIVRRIVMLYQSGSDFREAEVCIHGQFDRSRADAPTGNFWRRQP